MTATKTKAAKAKKIVVHGPKAIYRGWAGLELKPTLAIQCMCKLNCISESWELAGAAFDEHLRMSGE